MEVQKVRKQQQDLDERASKIRLKRTQAQKALEEANAEEARKLVQAKKALEEARIQAQKELKGCRIQAEKELEEADAEEAQLKSDIRDARSAIIIGWLQAEKNSTEPPVTVETYIETLRAIQYESYYDWDNTSSEIYCCKNSKKYGVCQC